MSYSLDFRRKVLAVRETEGLTISEVASRFYVGVATVVRWLKRLEPHRTREKPATKIDMQALAQDVRTYPDAYHHERAERLGVSKSCVYHALKRMGVTYKKSLQPPKGLRRRTTELSKHHRGI